jgi:hypothetical protein
MGTIFISYRRDDSSGHTGRLFDALSNRFGSESVFRDIEDLEPGIDFVEALDKALDKCDVLLLIIGRSWSTIEGPRGRRLDQPEDFVRMEVAKALERNVRLVPVLVDGATMPGAEELPENLRLLARRNAIELSDTRWDYDIGRLGDTLAKVLKIEQPAAAGRDGAAPTPPATQNSSLGAKVGAAIAAAVVLAAIGSIYLSFDDALPTVEPVAEAQAGAATVEQQAAAIDARQGFGTNGFKVSQVTVGDPNTGVAAGHFMVAGTSVWVETGPSGKDAQFKFREVGRDDWSVYLEDPSRNMSIQLDLHTRLVSFGDIGKDRSPLYNIVGAK